MTALLVDVGNSRIKWAYADNQGLSYVGAEYHNQELPQALTLAWLGCDAPNRVVCSNVAGSDYASLLSTWCVDQWGIEVEYAETPLRDPRLELAYSEPRKLGVDRWLAMIAAQQIKSTAMCVIDCGTAVTIDLVYLGGKHGGGLILPGLSLMRKSLAQNTDAIEHNQNASQMNAVDFLGASTEEGISKGTLNAVAGAIERVVSKIKADMNMPITCVVTGGDAALIKGELGSDYQYEPNLVLQGLLALIAE
ncbi:type III pantothenate kinase [Pseudomonadota bacterium]